MHWNVQGWVFASLLKYAGMDICQAVGLYMDEGLIEYQKRGIRYGTCCNVW